MVKNAVKNAEEQLQLKILSQEKNSDLLSSLGERFKLNFTPSLIEVYDNSHNQGDSNIGALIAFGKDGFIKNRYRKFNIKNTKIKSNDDNSKIAYKFFGDIINFLNDGKPAREFIYDRNFSQIYKELNLLTSKPTVYICNVAEIDAHSGNELSKLVEAHALKLNCQCVVISASTESELSILNEEEKKEYLNSIGLEETGLNKIIRTGYKILNLITYFTSGPKETRAWTVQKETIAPRAAAVIHTDFEKGFIRAETISYDDFITFQGEQGSKEAGKMRLEGKDYIVKDGDIMHFRFAN